MYGNVRLIHFPLMRTLSFTRKQTQIYIFYGLMYYSKSAVNSGSLTKLRGKI